MNITLDYHPYAKEIEVHNCESRFKAVCCGRRTGKALDINTLIPVPTPELYKRMGDLQVGDEVFDESGKICNVTYVTPFQFNRKCYAIEFYSETFNEIIISDAEHRWRVNHNGVYKILETENMLLDYLDYIITYKDAIIRIKNIVQVDSRPVKCISVDSPNNLYLCGKNFVPTHNTFMGVYECFNKIRNHKGKDKLQIGWIAPTYQNSVKGIDTFKRIGVELLNAKLMKISKTSPYCADIFGHKIYFLTADNADAIRGYYFDMMVVDEGAYVPDSVWHSVLKPTLLDRSGNVFAMSTPSGKRGWFYELCMAGMNKNIKNTSYFHWTSYDNPHLKEEETGDIADLKRTLPMLTFRQEVMAEFIASDNQVFISVDNCLDEGKCKCNCAPVIGCDLAKKVDYTVLISLCPECIKVRDLLRFHKIPWGEQQQKIVRFYHKHRARKLYIDCTGIGDVVVDNLKLENLRLEPVIFTNKSKNQMMSDLTVYIEQGRFRWSDDLYPILKEELLALERTATRNSVSYSAAINFTDDAVMAAGLALKGVLASSEYYIASLGDYCGYTEDGKVDLADPESDLTNMEILWDDLN